MSKAENAELWAERLRRFELVDTTVPAFCVAEGVSQPSYYHWRRKLRGPAINAESQTACPPSRSTLQNIEAAVEFALRPLAEYLRSVLKQDRTVGCDDTGV